MLDIGRPAERCRTVLLVEDTLDDEQLILRAMSRLQIPTLTKIARDGAQTLDILEMEFLLEDRKCRCPDLVLCDMKLPKLMGHEVLRHVRFDTAMRSVPFVIFSSSDEVSDQERCRNGGCDGYVVKPVDYRRFTQVVVSTVERFLMGRCDGVRPKEALLWG